MYRKWIFDTPCIEKAEYSIVARIQHTVCRIRHIMCRKILFLLHDHAASAFLVHGHVDVEKVFFGTRCVENSFLVYSVPVHHTPNTNAKLISTTIYYLFQQIHLYILFNFEFLPAP